MEHNRRDWTEPRQVRRIGPTRRSVSGRLAFRGTTSVPFESTLERDFLLRVEFLTAVAGVVAQPVVVPFTSPSGREYPYTPDYLVHRRDGPSELVEVKPASEWRRHWREWFPKWKAARRLARARGWTFRIHDESRIRGPALETIRFLQRYRRLAPPEPVAAELIAAVAAAGRIRVDDLLARHTDAGSDRAAIQHLWHLVAGRRLDCDIGRALDATTELRPVDHG